jgi:hypothetical protein
MTVRVFAGLMIIMLASAPATAFAAADVAAIDARIQKAADAFRGVDKPGDSGMTGLRLLTEAAALAAPDSDLSGDCKKKIVEAEQVFRTSGRLDSHGVDLLNQAYSLAHSGRPFRMPEGIDSIKQATDYALKQLGAARGQLKGGKVSDCARTILEVIAMIITPMPAPGDAE